MNLEARKLTIIEKFIHIKNDAIITQVENILANVKTTNEFKPFTLDQLNNRVETAMLDSKKGDLISQKALKAEIKKWN